MISHTEENYLKAIYKLSGKSDEPVATNSISEEIQTSAASVTDMIKRLSEKGMAIHEKYKGVRLSPEGERIATNLVRKHRLWEVFLVDKLNFSWDEVHEIAEQLEHIKSESLVERLDQFLKRPKFDPHGDPIPDKNGIITYRKQILLSEMDNGEEGVIVGVQENSPTFLQFLERLDLVLGTPLKLLEIFEYDNSLKILINSQKEQILSAKVGQNLFIQVD